MILGSVTFWFFPELVTLNPKHYAKKQTVPILELFSDVVIGYLTTEKPAPGKPRKQKH